VRSLAEALPWFLPGLAVSIVVGLLVAPLVARALGAHRSVAVLFVVSIGAIVSATILPTAGGFDWTAGAVGRCDVDGPWLAPLDRYLRPTEPSLNVLLFVPLGIAIALLPRSRRAVAIGAALIAVAVAIESTQLLIPILGRSCEMSDVVNNTLGLTMGFFLGASARVIAGSARSVSARMEAR
jgi:hypothetical protein